MTAAIWNHQRYAGLAVKSPAAGSWSQIFSYKRDVGNTAVSVLFLCMCVTCGGSYSPNQDGRHGHDQTAESSQEGEDLSVAGRGGGENPLEIHLPRDPTQHLDTHRNAVKTRHLSCYYCVTRSEQDSMRQEFTNPEPNLTYEYSMDRSREMRFSAHQLCLREI